MQFKTSEKIFEFSAPDIFFSKLILENFINEEGNKRTHLTIIIPPEIEYDPDLSLLKLDYRNGRPQRNVFGDLVIEIHGQNKVLEALNYCLEAIVKSEEKNYYSTQIHKLISKWEAIRAVTPSRQAPAIRINPHEYELVGDLETQSMHKVKSVTYKGMPAFLKEEPRERGIVDIEAYNSLRFEVLLGDQAAKTRPVYTPEGKRVGVLSIGIPNFKAYKDFQPHEITVDQLIKDNIGKILAAAYCLKESDLHTGNHGPKAKIDHDRTSYDLTKKYAPEYFILKDEYSIERNVKFTRRDMKDFPDVQDADFNNWVNDEQNRDLFHVDELKNHFKIKEDKYFIWLKNILIPHEFNKQAAIVCSSSSTKADKMALNTMKETQELRNVLFTDEEFFAFVVGNKEAFNEIKNEFITFNQTMKNDGVSLAIDLERVEYLHAEILAMAESNLAFYNTKKELLTVLIEGSIKEFQGYVNSRDSSTFRKYFRNPKLTQEKKDLVRDKIKILEKLKSERTELTFESYQDRFSQELKELKTEDEALEAKYKKRDNSFRRSKVGKIVSNLSTDLETIRLEPTNVYGKTF